MMVRVLSLATVVALTAASPVALASPPSPTDHSPLATATQLGLAFSSVAETVSPSVVSIRVEVRAQAPGMGFFFPFGDDSGSVQKGSGSGVVLASDGAILTNHHVVQNASRIEVQLKDGRRFQARVVGVDPATDLAVLRIDAKELVAVRFADSDAAEVGQWVVAIGSPFGLDYTVTAGVLSAKGRGGLGANEIEDYLQTDASINPGNSGGPLVNLMGEVLGINTMIIGRASGIGFAIPSNLVRRVANELLSAGSVHRAWIGVSYQELTPELASSFGVNRTRGALINDVVAGGPAEKAGLRPGDIVLEVAGREIREGRDVLRAVVVNPVGAALSMKIAREGGEQILSIVTTERPGSGRRARRGVAGARRAGNSEPELGLELIPLSSEIARRLGYDGPGGVVVSQVIPGSASDRAGLVRGDVIEEVNKRPASNLRAVFDVLGQGHTLLRIRRQGGLLFMVVE